MDDVTSKCEDRTELTYPELDTVNVPELKDTLDNSYQKDVKRMNLIGQQLNRNPRVTY